MYDPLIVDTFIRVHPEIAPDVPATGTTRSALTEIAGASGGGTTLAVSPPLDEIAASADEMLTLYELAQALTGQASISDTGDIIAKHLRRLVPFSLCVFYIYDAALDEVEAKHAMGDAAAGVKGIRVPLGQRLSGWVAANRQTIMNSDPTLDLGEVARCVTPRLRSCLSTPMTAGDSLVGVLTLYSCTVDSFTEDHRRIAEAVARQIGPTFKSAAEFDKSVRRDPLTGLPTVRQLEQLVESTGAGETSRASLLLIEIVGFKQIALVHGRTIADEVLRSVVSHARAGLRVADILFRSANDAFVALLNDTDFETATVVASRTRESIRGQTYPTGVGMINVDATITCVCAPQDGQSLRDLIATARLRHVAQWGATIH